MDWLPEGGDGRDGGGGITIVVRPIKKIRIKKLGATNVSVLSTYRVALFDFHYTAERMRTNQMLEFNQN